MSFEEVVEFLPDASFYKYNLFEHGALLFGLTRKEVGAGLLFALRRGVDVEGVEEIKKDGYEPLSRINILPFYLCPLLILMGPLFMQLLLALEKLYHLMNGELLRNFLPP